MSNDNRNDAREEEEVAEEGTIQGRRAGDGNAGGDNTPKTTATTATKSATATRGAEFEFQELRVLLEAMHKQGLASRDLLPRTRLEMEAYARAVVVGAANGKNGETSSSAAALRAKRELIGTRWRLGFSTHSATLGDLPRDATVYLEFVDADRMLYKLQFSQKTFGLNSIQAESAWSLDDERNGLLTFVYDRITTDAFGFTNVGVGLFGLLKGRANYVETAYYDGKYWIEQGQGVDGNGDDFVNVYVREESDDDDDIWNK
jgi:hypothetical protein